MHEIRGQQALRAVAPGFVQDVGLYREVRLDEFRRVVVVARIPPTFAAATKT